MCKIKSLNKKLRFCLAVCSINCEVLPYLPHLGKLACGLFHAALATKQR